MDDKPEPKGRGKRKADSAPSGAPPVKKGTGKKTSNVLATPDPTAVGKPLTAAQKRKEDAKQLADRRRGL